MLDELIKTLTPRLLLLLVLAITSLTLTSAWTLFFRPPISDYRELTQRFQTLQQQAANPDTSALDIQQLRQQIADLNTRLSETGREVLRGTSALNVMADLGNFAEQQQIQLLGITPGEPMKGNLYTEIPFQVELAGSYRHLFNWVHTLEHATTPLLIKQFSMQAGVDAEHRELRLTVALIQPAQEQ